MLFVEFDLVWPCTSPDIYKIDLFSRRDHGIICISYHTEG